jgi:multiple sugar transport system ATP-binding protein
VDVTLPSGARIVVPTEGGGLHLGDAVTLGLRPEALHPDEAGALAGEVRLVERLGGLTLLHVNGDGDVPLTVQLDGADATRAHQPIRLSFDAAACHLFGSDGQALPHLARHRLVA